MASVRTCASALLLGLLPASLSLAAEGTPSEYAQTGTGTTEPPPTPLALPGGDVPARRLNLDHFLGGGYNPLVLEYSTRATYRMRLSDSQDILWKDTFLALGGQVRVNPCYTAVGPMVDWQPIAVFNLRALVDYFGFFGTFGMMQSFPSPLSDFSTAVQDARSAAGDTYATSGWHAMLRPTLQAQLGPIAIQNVLSAEYWDIRLRGGDTVWADAGPDTLLPGKGWTLTDEVNLVYLQGPLTLGATFRYVTPLYTQEHFQPNEDPKSVDLSNIRAGVLGAWRVHDGGYSSFSNLTVFGAVMWHLKHPYRAGVESSILFPFMVVGVSLQQDFVL
jgi:hypothetical protein